MSVTLESQPCPHCGAENSIHIDDCRLCHRPLPWAGTEQTQLPTQPAIRSKPKISRAKIIWLYVGGATVFVIGVGSCLYTVFHNRGPSGIVLIVAGIAWCGYATNLAMGIDEMPK